MEDKPHRKSVSFHVSPKDRPADDGPETEHDAAVKRNTQENSGIFQAKAPTTESEGRNEKTNEEKVAPKEETHDGNDSSTKPPPPEESKPKPPLKGALRKPRHYLTEGPSLRSNDIRAMAEASGSQLPIRVAPEPKDKPDSEPKKEKPKEEKDKDKPKEKKGFNMVMKETKVVTDLSAFMRGKNVTLQTPAEELEEISNILKEDVPTPGANYYLIASRWWNLWQLYVRQQGNGVRPPEINNRPLLLSDHNEFVEGEKPFYRLKNNLQKSEYQIIPERAWTKLQAWYGGGPPISRKIVSRGIATVTLFVELYPLHLRIMKVEHEEIRRFDFSQVTLAKEVRKACSSKWGIPLVKCHLFLHQTEITDKDNLNKTLEELGVQDYQVILMRGAEQFTQLASKRMGFSEVELKNNFVDQEGAPPVPGAVGIMDMGNTSYMGAILQCLIHLPEFHSYFMGDFAKDINEKNHLGMKGELATAVGKLVQLVSSGKIVSTAPLSFKAIFGKCAPQFSGAARQDIMEFFTFLLNGIHEDLKKVIPLMGIESSRMTDLFQGQTKTKYVCGECATSRVDTEPFMSVEVPIPTKNERLILVTLIPSSAVKCDYGIRVSKSGTVKDVIDGVRSLAKCGNVRIYFEYDQKEWLMNEEDEIQTIPKGDQLFAYEVDAAGKVRGRDDGIPSNKHPSVNENVRDAPVTLYNCLEKMLSRQTLARGAWTCTKCDRPVESATCKKSIEIFPEILVLSPERFQTMEAFQDKITTPIDFPFQLEIPSGERYELINFACHRGTTESGNFVAFAKCDDDKWYEFDNLDVKPVNGAVNQGANQEDVVALFYRKSSAPTSPAPEAASTGPTKGPPRLLRTMSRTTSMGNVNQYAPPRSNLVVASPLLKRDRMTKLFAERANMLKEQNEGYGKEEHKA